ncbi:MAG: class IIb bacteriocin, lactobin A/cerein 7B family [Cecembia sp.]
MEKFEELSFEESQEVEGGVWPVIWVGIKWLAGGIATAAAVELVTEGWDSAVNDFNEGYNEVRNNN